MKSTSLGREIVCDADGSCASAYKGDVIKTCGDCGAGVDKALPPGGTVDIPWDHRGYVKSTAPEACSGVPGGAECSLAVLIDATTAQKGTLTVCSTDGSGACTGKAGDVNFTVDTTKSEATIEVM